MKPFRCQNHMPHKTYTYTKGVPEEPTLTDSNSIEINLQTVIHNQLCQTGKLKISLQLLQLLSNGFCNW